MSRLTKGLQLISSSSLAPASKLVFELGSYQTRLFFPEEKKSEQFTKSGNEEYARRRSPI